MAVDAATQDANAALPLLSRALAYESSLRIRTEGLTWAVWGLVFALVFFMYGGTAGEFSGPWVDVLWIPWILVGGALTWALWRTAALELVADERRPAGLAVTLAWLVAVAAGFGVVLALTPHGASSESTALLAVGLAWLTMGGTNLLRATPTGRRHVLVIGALVLAAGLASALLLPRPQPGAPDADALRFLHDLLRGSVAGLVPIAVGLRQALRG